HERTQRRKAMRSITSATVQGGDVSIRSQTAPVRRVRIAVAAVVALSVMGPGAATWAADTTTAANTTDTAVATKHLSVDLATDTGPSIGVAQGILYGLSEDATQPSKKYLEPLNLNAFRGGGWFAGGWRGDGY